MAGLSGADVRPVWRNAVGVGVDGCGLTRDPDTSGVDHLAYEWSYTYGTEEAVEAGTADLVSLLDQGKEGNCKISFCFVIWKSRIIF